MSMIFTKILSNYCRKFLNMVDEDIVIFREILFRHKSMTFQTLNQYKQRMHFYSEIRSCRLMQLLMLSILRLELNFKYQHFAFTFYQNVLQVTFKKIPIP